MQLPFPDAVLRRSLFRAFVWTLITLGIGEGLPVAYLCVNGGSGAVSQYMETAAVSLIAFGIYLAVCADCYVASHAPKSMGWTGFIFAGLLFTCSLLVSLHLQFFGHLHDGRHEDLLMAIFHLNCCSSSIMILACILIKHALIYAETSDAMTRKGTT